VRFFGVVATVSVCRCGAGTVIYFDWSQEGHGRQEDHRGEEGRYHGAKEAPAKKAAPKGR
jgi:hypothetical protein